MVMKTKKPWINYMWWFLLTVCTIFFTMQAARQAGNDLIVGGSPLVQSGFVGLSFVVITIIGLLIYIAGRGIGPRVKEGKIIKILIEAVYWLMLGALFVLRFLYRMTRGEGDLTLLNSALIQSGEIEKNVLSHGSALYVDVLSFLFSFLGNNEEMVLYLQFILQILTVIILYFVVLLLCGRIAAYGAGLLLTCSACWMEAVTVFKPEVIYMFFWSLIWLVLVIFYAIGTFASFERRSHKIGQGVAILMLGALCGALTYFDILGILLVPMGIYLLFIAEKNCFSLAFWIKTVILLVGFCLGGFAMFFQKAVMQGNTVYDSIQSWSLQHVANITLVTAIPTEPTLLLVIMMMLACFLTGAFWLDVKPNFSIWVLIMLLLSVISPILGIAGLKQTMWITLVWSVLGGLGLQNMILAGIAAGKKAEMKVIEQEQNKEPDKEQDKEQEKEQDKEQEPAAQQPEFKQQEIKPSPDGEVSRYDRSAGTKYIENPLPLPPKPVKKSMDFPLEIPKGKMYYDVQVSDGDDYDLK